MATEMTAQDKMDVIDLIADYAFTLEAGDLDGYVNNFTPDGIWSGGGGEYQGREAIRAFVTRLIEIGQDGPNGHDHILGIPYVRGNSERCHAKTYLIIPAETASEETVHIGSIGVYVDEIVKWEGRWRFEKRHLRSILRRKTPS